MKDDRYRVRVEETLEAPVNKRLNYHCIVNCIVRETIFLDNAISNGYNAIMTPEGLKAWREKNKYSQQSLAAALGVIQVTIARWETGVRKIPPFLHLALRCLETEGGEPLVKGTRKRKGGRQA